MAKVAKSINKDVSSALVKLSADALKSEGYEALGKQVEGMESFEQVSNFFATNSNPNTLAGSLYGFLAKQFIKTNEVKELYGDLFVEGEEINIGSGFSYIENVLNTVGVSDPINYQTSTEAMGTIAFGSSAANSSFINATVSNLPFNQIAQGLNNWCTINITIPASFASFSGLSPIKAEEILNLYQTNLKAQHKLFYYTLGNTLFTYFIKNGYFANIIFCDGYGQKVYNQTLSNATGPYTPPVNLIDALQSEIIPLLEHMRQLHWGLNLGFNMLTESMGVWGFNSPVSGLEYVETNNTPSDYSPNLPAWVNLNSNGHTGPSLKAVDLDDLIIICSVKVSASLKTLLASNYLGVEKIDAEFNGNKLTRLCGVKVVVAGVNISGPQQVSQGQVQTSGSIGNNLIDDNTIIIMEKDALTFHKYYDALYKTDTLVSSMVQLARQQIGFLPWLNPWKNGVIMKFNPGILTSTQYLTVKSV